MQADLLADVHLDLKWMRRQRKSLLLSGLGKWMRRQRKSLLLSDQQRIQQGGSKGDSKEVRDEMGRPVPAVMGARDLMLGSAASCAVMCMWMDQRCETVEV